MNEILLKFFFGASTVAVLLTLVFIVFNLDEDWF